MDVVSKDMSIARLFRRHLLLAARLQAGKPLSRSGEPPSPGQLDELIEKAEARGDFVSGQNEARTRGVFEEAELAVNAVINEAARSQFKQDWTPEVRIQSSAQLSIES